MIHKIYLLIRSGRKCLLLKHRLKPRRLRPDKFSMERFKFQFVQNADRNLNPSGTVLLMVFFFVFSGVGCLEKKANSTSESLQVGSEASRGNSEIPGCNSHGRSNEQNPHCQVASTPTPTPTPSPTPYVPPSINGWQLLETGAGGSSVERVHAPQAVSFNSKLYRAKVDVGSGNGVVRVDVMSSATANPLWNSVNGGAGINVSTAYGAYNPKLVVFDGKLYIFWTESLSSGYLKVHAKVFGGIDASPAWTNVDGDSIGILNIANHQSSPTPFVFNSKMYLIFRNGNSVRVAVYNSDDANPAWSYVDAGALNYGATNFTGNNAPELASVNGKLYAIWGESASANCCYDQIRVKVYGGNDAAPTWSFVDGGGANGLNRNLGGLTLANGAGAITFNSKLYVYWNEKNHNTPSTVQIHVSVFNGNDGTPSWTSVDPGPGGISYDPTKISYVSSASVLNGALYFSMIEYRDWIDTPASLRVAHFDGNDSNPAWSFDDGGSQVGLVRNSANSVNGSAMIAFESKLYLIWAEGWGGPSELVTAVKAP